MKTVQIQIKVPKVLAISLLHIGAQHLALLVNNPGAASTAATELEARIPELSVEATTAAVPKLSPGQSAELKVALSLAQLDRMRLLDMLNQQDGLPCNVQVKLGSGLVAEQGVKVLPPNAWLYRQNTEALAAFVDKESEAVQRIKLAARPHLRRHLGVGNFKDAIDKPLSELRIKDEFTRMEQIVAAVYECLLQSHRIHYEAEPRTYPEDWQKIRFHEQVLSEKQGTCIDLALLMAACLEDAFLNPVLILFKTGPSQMHMILGCWETESKASSPVIRDYSQLDRWLGPTGAGGGRMLSWDATGFSVETGWTFSQACDEGLTAFHQAGPKNFVCAVDIARARGTGISPMPFSPGTAQAHVPNTHVNSFRERPIE